MTLMTATAMVVVITIIMLIIVEKDVAIVADMGMPLIVITVVVIKMTSMTVIVDCQEQARFFVTKIPVDNNIISYFSYILKYIFLALVYKYVSTLLRR